MAKGPAGGILLDECRRGGHYTRGVAIRTETASDRIRSFLVSVGALRSDENTTVSFSRRMIDDRFVLADLEGKEASATLCYLPERDVLLLDEGGPLLENGFVRALQVGYFDHHDGDFALHAQPFGPDTDVETITTDLEAAGLLEGDRGKGPFGEALTSMIAELPAE